jgi:nucleoside-diphosphate-sugar epimerase
MSTSATPPTTADLAEEVSAWAVGGGIITMALVPLALPVILLTAAAVVPLLVLGLAVAVVVAVVAAPLLLLRRLSRAIPGFRRPQSGVAAATGARTAACEVREMRVFVAGASGAIGTHLVPQLIDGGHEVVGTSRSQAGAERVRALGAEPLVLDLLDPRAVRTAVLAAEPDAVVHQATALADVSFSRNFDRTFAQTNRLRTDGTDALLAAAREAGVRRFVAQSFASTLYAREGGPVKTEADPLDPNPTRSTRESLAATRYLDEAVRDAGGIALRYGGFYGTANDGLVEPVRKRRFPVVGDGGGVWSFIHLADAAAATVLALDRHGPAAYNVVDDEPAPVRDWLPVLARVLGAKPPLHVPRGLARLLAGDAVVTMLTDLRAASNAKAKRDLGWELRYPSWREGFAAAYASKTRAPAIRKAVVDTAP